MTLQVDLQDLALQPWLENPYRLVTWWGMEKFAAERFYLTGCFLTSSIAAVAEDTLNVEQLTTWLSMIRGECEAVGLRISIHSVDAAVTTVTDDCPNIDHLRRSLGVLQDVIRWEMQEHVFMYLPAERAERYDLQEGFGPEVSNNFPSAKFDIWEAGNCYAAGRYTACVFHLMRALEVVLVAFAAIFDVPSDRTNWHNIIEGIESKIRDMGNDPAKAPDWKSKQEFYSQAANSFMFFKEAWRNYTAHARGKYVEHEADTIYRNVRAFMQKIAERLSENEEKS